MKLMKRASALLLSAVMIATTMGTMTAFALTKVNVTTSLPNGYSSGETIKGPITIEVDHSDGGGTLSKDVLSVGDTVTFGGGDFSSGTLKVTAIDTSPSVEAKRVKYTVQATDLVPNKDITTDAKLKFTVPYKAGTTPADSGELTATITVKTSGGGGTPTPPAGDSNARYTLHKVSPPASSNGTGGPASRPRYDINNITSSSDASVRQTYYIDIVVKMTDAAIPSTLTDDNILVADMGSFVFDSAAGSAKQFVKQSDGYCEIKFTNLRYTGNGKNLTFRIENPAYTNDIVVAISECVSRSDASAAPPPVVDDDPKLEAETPYVIVNNYGYGGGTVTAGETFNLSLTFVNTSAGIDVSNMMITLSMPEDLMLTSSSNTFYIPELNAEKSITKSVQVTAKPAAKAQSHNVGVAMKYQYIDTRNTTRRSAETTENIAVPIVQVDRFQVTAVDIPMDIMLEEETSVSVSFVNKGRSEVYNLAASIDGNILNPGQNQNLGNLASGMTGTADFFIKPNEAGQVSGTITITYEDTNMEEKTATIPYNATVKTMAEMDMGGGMYPGMGGMMPGMGEEMPMEPEKKSPLPVIIIVAVAILIPVAVVVKKKLDKKRKEQEDADL